jgi:hypothetical protein
LKTTGGEREDAGRVQVLFRPEDVAVKDAAEALEWPRLGEAVVEESSFFGSVERLRVRIPELKGLRMIDPPPVFGEEGIVVEASRSQHQARRYPLAKGDAAGGPAPHSRAPAPGLRLLAVAGEDVGDASAVAHAARAWPSWPMRG